MVLVNGNIVTMNSAQPKAQAVAIKNGKFVTVGTNRQILSYAEENTKRIDLKGKTVVPGFVDAHVHGASLGRVLSQINLRNVKSIKEIQRKVKQWTKKTAVGKWIIGRGWDQDKLIEHRYPSRFDLDQAAPRHPVFLLRVCGHLGVVNSKAMRLAGITEQTEPPEGGCIDKDPKTGELNGILQENARNLIYKVLPESSEKNLTSICLLACQRMVEEGITTAHWIISSASELHVLQKLNSRNMLPLRIYVLIPVEFLDNLVELGLSTGFGGDKIKVGSIKILADGSLGARTAALKQPYNDTPETEGMMLYSQKQLEKFVEKAHEANLQLAIHAIGDKTVEVVLKILEKELGKVPKENHRHRLEHVSVLNPRLIKKMREIGVIASVQPHFVVSDFWIVDRLGKARARWAYAFKSLFKEGIMNMGGSDAPVEPISPILGVYAAVARKTFPQEQLTVEEALRLYTINAAYGSFEEDIKGSIEKGKLADFVVLSQDPYKTAPKQIKNIKVEMTIVGGNTVYTRKQ
ncbi:MAG: amidohydrolase [Candidatus Bathyarchaeota archaeon]|nr:amidohydrolase [Candidatus Bathyarchaeota archaeon]